MFYFKQWEKSKLSLSSPVLHLHQPGFYKGVAGSQVTLSSLVNQSRAMLEEQARHLLTEAERQTMGYYVEEYRDGHIGVEQLVDNKTYNLGVQFFIIKIIRVIRGSRKFYTRFSKL